MPGRPDGAGTGTDETETASAFVVLPVMLHARPAALIAREVGDRSATLTVDGADAASVLDLMRLGAMPGQRLKVVGRGPGAAEAVSAVVGVIANGLAGADVHPG